MSKVQCLCGSPYKRVDLYGGSGRRVEAIKQPNRLVFTPTSRITRLSHLVSHALRTLSSSGILPHPCCSSIYGQMQAFPTFEMFLRTAPRSLEVDESLTGVILARRLLQKLYYTLKIPRFGSDCAHESHTDDSQSPSGRRGLSTFISSLHRYSH